MININNVKTAPQSIKYLTDIILGPDPEVSALSRVYESDTPIQDRITAVENSAALVDVQALKDKVDALSELTEVFANLAYPMPNLIENSDLTLDSNSDNIPDGFTYVDATDITLINGIAKYTAAATNGRLFHRINNNSGDIIYAFANFKVTFTYHAYANVRLEFNGEVSTHSGGGQFEYVSMVKTTTASNRAVIISDARTGVTGYEFSPIEVDYIGAYNVSDMQLKGVKNDEGVPFTLLTNEQIKTQLDLWVQTRFPLDVLLIMRG